MLPLPNLDDKTFSQLLEDAKKKIPRYAPEWTDHNVHDPGITMIEMFAWLAEQQHYYLNQIRPENEWKFLKLLGINPKEIKPAQADVTFSFVGKEHKSGIYVPSGTKLSASGILFETEEPLWVVATELKRIVSWDKQGIRDYTDSNQRKGLEFFAFGKDAEEDSRLYLGFETVLPESKPISITFYLKEDYPVVRGSHGNEIPNVTPSASVEWEYYSKQDGGTWHLLKPENDDTMQLSNSGRLTFLAPRDMLKYSLVSMEEGHYYWIRARVKKAGFELPPKIKRISLNTVSVVQRETIKMEEIGASNGLPGQTFSLNRELVISNSVKLKVRERVDGKLRWTEWLQVDSYDASGPTDKHYRMDSETGALLFGDGVHGAIPQASIEPDRNNLRVESYQVSLGARGNVGPLAITDIITPKEYLKKLKVENLYATSGGSDKETLEEAKIRMRKEMKKVTRAVTSEDYEFLAKSTPGLRVARAKALPLLGKDLKEQKGVVTVVVIPFSEYANPVPSEGFLANVCCHLNRHRLITTEVQVVPPVYVKATVDAFVYCKSGYETEKTRERIIEALNKFLHPIEGGPSGNGWPFGRAIYISEIYETIERVPGVDCVHRAGIEASGNGVTKDSNGNVSIPPLSLVYSETHLIDVTSVQEYCRPKGDCYGK